MEFQQHADYVVVPVIQASITPPDLDCNKCCIGYWLSLVMEEATSKEVFGLVQRSGIASPDGGINKLHIPRLQWYYAGSSKGLGCHAAISDGALWKSFL